MPKTIQTHKLPGQRLVQILDRASKSISNVMPDNDMSNSYTIFKRGEALFGIPTEHVLEIMDKVAIHSVPGTQAHSRYIGISQYHGQICPCIDIEKKLAATPLSAVALSHKEHVWFLMIDSLVGVGAVHDAKMRYGKDITLVDPFRLASECMQEILC